MKRLVHVELIKKKKIDGANKKKKDLAL